METKLYNGDIVEGQGPVIRRQYFELIWLLAYNHHVQHYEIVLDKAMMTTVLTPLMQFLVLVSLEVVK